MCVGVGLVVMSSHARLKVFFSFVFFGVLIGLVENLLVVYFATSHPLDLSVFVISLLVVIPFAALGELIVDRHPLLPHADSAFVRRLELFLEFFVFGMVMGVVEDLLVITLITGGGITLEVVGIVALVTLPFAVFGELVVDRTNWFTWLRKTPLVD